MSFDEITRCLSSEDQKIIGDMLALFDGIDRQTEKFAGQTGLKCKNGCGACCTNPDIETTIAEVLPLAVHLWSKVAKVGTSTTFSNQKVVDVPTFYEAIRSGSHKRVCVFYEPDPLVATQGRCGIYAYRPGLCRLFGFAARKDKYGQPVLVTCKVIKDSQPQTCKQTQKELEKGLQVPLLTAHAFAVANIDPVGGRELLPINQAIRRGMEKIGYTIEKLKQ